MLSSHFNISTFLFKIPTNNLALSQYKIIIKCNNKVKAQIFKFDATSEMAI